MLQRADHPSVDTFATLSAWFTVSPSFLRINSAELLRTGSPKPPAK